MNGLNPDVLGAGVALAVFSGVAVAVRFAPRRFTEPGQRRPIRIRRYQAGIRPCANCRADTGATLHRSGSYTCMTCLTTYTPKDT